jgi:hypothetical protein
MTSTGAEPSVVLFQRARLALAQAVAAGDPAERFCLAHLAALRIAAAVLAVRGRPRVGRRRLVSAWVLLDSLAPEFAEWAGYFAAGASSRAAIEAGATAVVSARRADDELRAAGEFLALVEARHPMLVVPLAS